MCEGAEEYADAMKNGADYVSAPRGRPPFAHRFVRGEWRHVETGELFDPRSHAAGVLARKQACMHRHYWLGGGRDQRLARYTKKRKLVARQITLPEMKEPHRVANP